MDYSKKPDRKNPRKGANPLSQFLFLWMVPVMFRVSHAAPNAAVLAVALQ